MLSTDTHLFSFAVIGDTHIKPESGDQSAPWKVNELATGRALWIAREIERYAPDFIVHLGDLVHPVPELSTFGEAVALTKTIFGSQHNRLHVVPGNHDIGDKPNMMMPAKMVRDEWIAIHEGNFGPSFHAFDCGECRFVFLNNPVLNSGSPIETRQRAWLEETLASAEGRRIFVFMHYPLFLLDPTEPGNYDNVDEPARADLLQAIRRHEVEAVFAGHVHNVFYHRVEGTEFYVLPATSFVRQDYAELFRIEAVHENGRNDAEKLGFSIVEVHRGGHVVHTLRSYGTSLEKGPAAPIAARSAVALLPHPKKAGGTPFGVFLRHSWAEITALPHNGPMDEFLRKEARNDYVVAALWRLGVRRVRVPLSDVLDERISRRMADLVALGHRFTVFGFGVPQQSVLETLLERASVIDRYECVLPLAAVAEAAPGLAAFRRRLDRPVLVSPLASSAADKKVGSRIELFVAHGFRPDQLAELDLLLAETAPGAIEHTVVRLDLGTDAVATVAALSRWQAERACRLDVHLRIAADNPAANVTDDAAILASVVTFYAAALAHPELGMFVDPFMDVDRGYFVRHGLIDRRCNLRPVGLAIEALTAHLGEGWDRPALESVRSDAGLVLKLRQGGRGALVLLPRDGASLRLDEEALAALDLDRDAVHVVPLHRPWQLEAALGDHFQGAEALPAAVLGPTLVVGFRRADAGATSAFADPLETKKAEQGQNVKDREAIPNQRPML